MTLAVVTHTSTGQRHERELIDPNQAVGHIMLLMRANGWRGNEEELRQKLLNGDKITLGKRVYHIE